MVYHLVQAPAVPLVIKDQAWYLKHLREMLQEGDVDFFSNDDVNRAFYLFDRK